MSQQEANPKADPELEGKGASSDAEVDPSRKAEQLEQEIVAVRENLGSLVSELDQRRHRAFDIPLQVRQHAGPVALGALALAGVVVGGLVWRHSRRAKQNSAEARLAMVRDKLLHAIGQKTSRRRRRRPSKDKEPAPGMGSVAGRILLAAAVGAASILGKRLALSLVNKPADPRTPSRHSV